MLIWCCLRCWLVLLLAFCNLALGSRLVGSALERPNVILFFIDDLGYMDLGCYGSTFHQTPQIDRLANRGVRFTQFYSANPVCSPTRAALMTGKAPHRLGITQWINQPSDLHLPLEETTIGEALESAGYKTGYIGKWHLGEKDNQQPDSQGFAWMRGVNRAGSPGSYFFPFKRQKKRTSVPYWDVPDLEHGEVGDYLNDKLTDEALKFISDAQTVPFFLCFAHYAVHTPIQAPGELTQAYQAKANLLPVLDRPFIQERNGGKTRARQDNPTYAAMVENLDTNVGRVIKHLEDLGLFQKTIIVFTSDNGGLSTTKRIGPTCCLPLRAGKGWTYEGGIRIPTVVVWPGKLKPAICETIGITMDLYPTLLDLVDLPTRPKQHLDGRSLAKTLDGQMDEESNSRFLAWTYPHHHGSQHSPSNAIREGNWKLVERTDDQSPASQRLELYDLGQDIGESKNLALDFPEKTEELVEKLHRWLDESSPSQLP